MAIITLLTGIVSGIAIAPYISEYIGELQAKREQEQAKEPGPELKVDGLMANLSQETRHYIQLDIVLELKEDQELEKAEKYEVALRSDAIRTLRSFSYEEIKDKENKGYYKMKEKLLESAQNILPGNGPVNIRVVEIRIT